MDKYIKNIMVTFKDYINEGKISDNKHSKASSNSSGGYTRLFDNGENIELAKRISDLFSKAQSTVISNGSELERLLVTALKNKIETTECTTYTLDYNNSKKYDNETEIKDVKSDKKHNIDIRLFKNSLKAGNFKDIPVGIYYCTKNALKKLLINEKATDNKHEIDVIVFDVKSTSTNTINLNINLVELKEGHQFDTKKSENEKTVLVEYKRVLETYFNSINNELSKISKKLSLNVNYYICLFNYNGDKNKAAKEGLKNNFTSNEILTGKELCKKIFKNESVEDILFNEIASYRKQDSKSNVKYVLKEFSSIVKEIIKNYADNDTVLTDLSETDIEYISNELLGAIRILNKSKKQNTK